MLAAVRADPVEFEDVADFRVAELGGDRFEFGDFAMVEALRLVALSANYMVVVMLVSADFQFEEGFARFGRDSGGDACGFEGFQISVDRDKVVSVGAKNDVGILGAERLLAIDQDQ